MLLQGDYSSFDFSLFIHQLLFDTMRVVLMNDIATKVLIVILLLGITAANHMHVQL